MQMSRKRSDIVFVNFFTKNYRARAAKLVKSLNKFALTHDVVEMEQEGSFEEIVSRKPEFIGMMMDAHPKAKAIVWLDADAVLVKEPKLFWELHGIDLACHFREGVELVASDMYWANTTKVKHQLTAWHMAMTKGEGVGLLCPEQQVLSNHLVDWNVNTYQLPSEYCFIEDLPEKNDAGRIVDPVVVQYQASRTERYRGEEGNAAPVTRVTAEKSEDLSIAILLPTRARPDSIKRLLNSIETTAAVPAKISVHLRLDGDDAVMLKAVGDIQKSAAVTVEVAIGPRVALGATWNHLWRNVDADIYMLCGDDILFESYHWDEAVREEFWGERVQLVFGDDGMNHERQATHWFVSHEGCELLGYFCPPDYEAIYLDTWVEDVYGQAGRKTYLADVKTTHMHWSKTGQIDESVARDRDGRKQRDQARYDAGAAARLVDAEKVRSAWRPTPSSEDCMGLAT